MNEYLYELFAKYRHKGILIDTNLLLLYVVGSLNPQLIPNFKRTTVYSVRDYEIVASVIEFFDLRIVTPHVLTEVSNLIGKRPEIRLALRRYITICDEQFVDSASLSVSEPFASLGLTDSAILDRSTDGCLVLTDDGPLASRIEAAGTDIVSLDLLRTIIV